MPGICLRGSNFQSPLRSLHSTIGGFCFGQRTAVVRGRPPPSRVLQTPNARKPEVKHHMNVVSKGLLGGASGKQKQYPCHTNINSAWFYFHAGSRHKTGESAPVVQKITCIPLVHLHQTGSVLHQTSQMNQPGLLLGVIFSCGCFPPSCRDLWCDLGTNSTSISEAPDFPKFVSESHHSMQEPDTATV